MASILNRQRNMALQQMQAREDAKKAEVEAKVKALAARPPRPPAGPLQKIPPTGIATMRRRTAGGRKRRERSTKTRKTKQRG
jgi:hypothetical protein